MSDSDYQKDQSIINPRSTVTLSGNQFIKTSDELNLQSEADELNRVKKFNAGTRHIRVPEILSYDSGSNILTTRLIHPSQSFYNMMWNHSSIAGFIKGHRLNRKKLLLRIEELGHWLKAYHDSTKTLPLPHEPCDNLIAMFDSKIETIRKQKNFNDRNLDKIRSFYVPALEMLADRQFLKYHDIFVCKIHGDFHISNMLVDDYLNIHILDFADTRIGFNIEDVARFYEQFWAMEQASVIHRKTFREAGEIFLKSYGFVEKTTASPVFSSILALNALIGCITEFTTRKFNRGQFVTQLEYKLLTWLSMKKIVRQMNASSNFSVPN